MNTLRTLGALSATTLLVLLGCEHEHGTTTGVSNPQAPEVDHFVVDQLASAACDREQRCFESGPSSRRFASRDDCMAHLRQTMANDLSAYGCAKGFEPTGLEHCESTISNEQCLHPLDTLSRKDDCRPASICNP